jgi:hypothetical protein
VIENSSASGIELEWNGSMMKDEMYIVTSELNFHVNIDGKDAAFISFFLPCDEQRFKVVVKKLH